MIGAEWLGLSQRDEAKLYRYYGLTAGMPAGGNGLGRLRRYLVPDLQT